jgi:hypothetical protein
MWIIQKLLPSRRTTMGSWKLVYRYRGSMLLWLLAIAVAGCQQKSNVATVRGKVLLDGKPLAQGMIATMPNAGRGANAKIKSDGTFELRTFSQNDGATIGVHKIAVVAHDAPANTGPESGSGKLLVPKRYTSPETSGLTIDVKPGDNSVELKLTSP